MDTVKLGVVRTPNPTAAGRNILKAVEALHLEIARLERENTLLLESLKFMRSLYDPELVADDNLDLEALRRADTIIKIAEARR